MYYELLNAGDRVLTITAEFLAIERNDGSVVFYPIHMENNKICLNMESATTIAYFPDDTDDIDEYVTESGVHIVNF